MQDEILFLKKNPIIKQSPSFDGRCLQHGFALHKFPKKVENGRICFFP